MIRWAILISGLYAVAALLWLIARLVRRESRLYLLSEFVGKSSAGFAMGLTVAVVLVVFLRLIGVFPPNGR